MWMASTHDIDSALHPRYAYVRCMCASMSGYKNCLSYRQPTQLPLAIYFALCCQGFVPQLKCICSPSLLCLTRPSHSARSHPCIAAYSGVQLANATRSAAAAHDKSLFIICIVIEQFPFLVPWIPPSARKLLPKWQSQQILPRSKLPAYGLVSYETHFIVGVA